jgi:hypothetical protein
MKRTRIKQISPTKKKHNELYRKAKNEYRKELCALQGRETKMGPLCERCQKNLAEDLHHKAGRNGFMLWHKPTFSLLCRPCHNAIHFGGTTQAEMDGWIVRLTRSEIEEIRKIEQPKLYD